MTTKASLHCSETFHLFNPFSIIFNFSSLRALICFVPPPRTATVLFCPSSCSFCPLHNLLSWHLPCPAQCHVLCLLNQQPPSVPKNMPVNPVCKPFASFRKTCCNCNALSSWGTLNRTSSPATCCLPTVFCSAQTVRLLGSTSHMVQKTLTALKKQWLVAIRRVFKELYLHVKRHRDIYVYQMAQSRWMLWCSYDILWCQKRRVLVFPKAAPQGPNPGCAMTPVLLALYKCITSITDMKRSESKQTR